MQVTKPLDLGALDAELTAAGVAHHALQLVDGTLLQTFDADGVPTDLPASAQPVVAAHNAATTPSAVQATQDSTALADARAQLTAMLTRTAAIRTDMATIAGTNFAALAGASTAIKTNAAAISDLTVMVDRLAKALAVLARRLG